MNKFSTLSILEKCSVVLAAALLVCLLPMPYGYYTLVRLAVTVIVGCMAYRYYHRDRKAAAVVAAGVVLLFQPFIPVAMDKLMWNVVDVVVAGALLLQVYTALFKKR